MTEKTSSQAKLQRELAYYRREYNDLGARVLRLQEEQSRAFREARRSRTVARLIREAYRLVEKAATPEEIGELMIEMILENSLADRAAILRQLPGEGNFIVTHALGFSSGSAPVSVFIPAPPEFFFTTAQTLLASPAYELTGILSVPFVLWAFDAGSGYALIIGNNSEGNVSRPFETADQELIEGALSVYIDIKAGKQAELELKAAKSEAEEANQTQANFLATLSHELRTPLNAVIGFSDLLCSAMPTALASEKRIEYAEHIREAGTYLLNLISDILDFSALHMDPLTLEEEWTDIVELIANTVRGLGPLFAEKNIAISAHVEQRIPDVLLDTRRMRQVMINLLGNALKFTPEGGKVEVRARLDAAEGDASQMPASQMPAGQMLTIEIEDNGIGIEAEEVDNVLKPFYQGKRGYSRSYGGTGLGLSISNALVQAHGGRIDIVSVVGRGTKVSVHLPADRLDGKRAPLSPPHD